MALACDREAATMRHHLDHRFYPQNAGKAASGWEFDIATWEAAAEVLRTMAIDPEASRRVLAGLRKGRAA
jgi:hypothetical protein